MGAKLKKQKRISDTRESFDKAVKEGLSYDEWKKQKNKDDRKKAYEKKKSEKLQKKGKKKKKQKKKKYVKC